MLFVPCFNEGPIIGRHDISLKQGAGQGVIVLTFHHGDEMLAGTADQLIGSLQIVGGLDHRRIHARDITGID